MFGDGSNQLFLVAGVSAYAGTESYYLEGSPSLMMAMGDGKLKLGYHSTRRLVINLAGGVGYLTTDPAFQYSGLQARAYFLAGTGVEYYLHIRHFCAGFNPHLYDHRPAHRPRTARDRHHQVYMVTDCF